MVNIHDNPRLRRTASVLCVVAAVLASALVPVLAVRFAWHRLHPRESEVYGVYVAHYEDGTETITVNRDHTYVQEVESTYSSDPVRNAGTWTWTNDDFGRIDLLDCWSVHTHEGLVRPKFASQRSLCRYPVERYNAFIFGPLYLFSSEEYPLIKVR